MDIILLSLASHVRACRVRVQLSSAPGTAAAISLLRAGPASQVACARKTTLRAVWSAQEPRAAAFPPNWWN